MIANSGYPDEMSHFAYVPNILYSNVLQGISVCIFINFYDLFDKYILRTFFDMKDYLK